MADTPRCSAVMSDPYAVDLNDRYHEWGILHEKDYMPKIRPMGDPSIPNPYPRYPTNEEIYEKWKKGEYEPVRTKEFPGYREPKVFKPGCDKHGNPVDLRTPEERNARAIRGPDREIARQERDKWGNIDCFDRDGKQVVNYEMIEDWEHTPHATKWSLDMKTVPRGIQFEEDRFGEPLLTEREWKRIMKMYADNPTLEETLEMHCMYMKSEPQIEFRKRYGLWMGFNKMKFRLGKPIFPKELDSTKEPPRITRDVIKR